MSTTSRPRTCRHNRGTLTEPGRDSPWRERSVEENLDLLRRMRAGEFPNGARVLRAKIDMAAGNINLRDPVLYRILHAEHPRTGSKWCIYPSYDFAHGQSDAIEGVTHSLCTLEFEDHRPLYDWLLDNLPVPSRPRQYEFARLNIRGTVLSKRVLTQLVRDGHVSGWDDPRMPTLAGLRRRGCRRPRSATSSAGWASPSPTAWSTRPCSISRSARSSTRPRPAHGRAAPAQGGDRELPEGEVEELEAVNNPEDPAAGSRRHRVFARALCGARRLHGGPAEKVLPPGAGARGAAALWLFHLSALAGCRPFCSRVCLSSPDWNISVTMSQPPMNSPLT
jgi:glutaminyl-tRNA synthetase